MNKAFTERRLCTSRAGGVDGGDGGWGGAKRDIGRVRSSPPAPRDDRKKNVKAAAIVMSHGREMTSSLANERQAQLRVRIHSTTCVKWPWKSFNAWILLKIESLIGMLLCFRQIHHVCGWKTNQNAEIAPL